MKQTVLKISQELENIHYYKKMTFLAYHWYEEFYVATCHCIRIKLKGSKTGHTELWHKQIHNKYFLWAYLGRSNSLLQHQVWTQHHQAKQVLPIVWKAHIMLQGFCYVGEIHHNSAAQKHNNWVVSVNAQ